MILDDEGFIAFAPFAQSFAGQIHLVPLRHTPSFAMASEDEVAALSTCLQLLLAKIDAVLDQPAYNLILREAPKPWNVGPAMHWYLELISRFTQLGGFELATGIPVNSLSPEPFVRDYLGRPLKRTTARSAANQLRPFGTCRRPPRLLRLFQQTKDRDGPIQ